MTPITLTAEQFDRLCAVMDVPTRTSEERRCSRVEHRTEVMVATVEKGVILPAVSSILRDISIRGSTLCHPTALRPGTQVVFYLGGEDNPIRLVGKVIQCKCFADSTALVGLQFTGFIDPVAARKRIA